METSSERVTELDNQQNDVPGGDCFLGDLNDVDYGVNFGQVRSVGVWEGGAPAPAGIYAGAPNNDMAPAPIRFVSLHKKLPYRERPQDDEIRIAQDRSGTGGGKEFSYASWEQIYPFVEGAFGKGTPASLYEARYYKTPNNEHHPQIKVDVPCCFYVDVDDRVPTEADHDETSYLGKIREDLDQLGIIEPWNI
jgi:hypothetical protein